MDAVHLFFRWLRRDFRIRYAQTSLGALWAVVQPLVLTFVFVVVFGRIHAIQTDVPYASFVLPAMLLWTSFTNGFSTSVTALAGSMYIASRVRYPRVVAPLAAATLPLVDLGLGIVVLPVLFALQGTHVQLAPLRLLAAAAGLLLITTGLGCLVAGLAMFVRDLRTALPVVLQVLLLGTPVAYPVTLLPHPLQWSPLAVVVTELRAGLFGTAPPSSAQLTVALGIGVLLAVAGVSYVNAVEARFTDVA